MAVSFEGPGANNLFAHEAGGHRWQRIPPTEKRGRVQTSTVTVAVLNPDDAGNVSTVREQDIEIKTARGSGPGGQHRNMTDSCVIATHRPTGETVRIDSRSQHQNRALAIRVLKARIAELDGKRRVEEQNDVRRAQVGSGQRADKIRTYRTRDNLITDHRSGRKLRLDAWMRGEW